MKKIFYLALLLWLLIGIFGVIYNNSYIDEVKYLYKGYLIFNNNVSYYKTPDFFYQHLPGVFLWFGLVQKIFGPSLLAGRLQSFIIGLFIPLLTYKLTTKIKNQQAGWLAFIMLILSPVLTLYYSSATPTSLIAFLFLLAFWFLYTKNFFLSSVFFTFLFIVRENFIFTLIFYLLFLTLIFRKNIKNFIANFFLVVIISAVFLLPGINEIIEIFKRIPGVINFLPVGSEEKLIFASNSLKNDRSLFIYAQSLVQFWSIYQLWIIIIIFIFLFGGINYLYKVISKIKYSSVFLFMIFIAGFNFSAHLYSALKVTPRGIIGYFPYFAPLFAIIIGIFGADLISNSLFKKRILAIFIFLFLCFYLPSLREVNLWGSPFNKPVLFKINQTAKELKKIIPQQEKVVWLAEAMPLYLSQRQSYYPLINTTHSYRPDNNTQIIKNLGFWNKEMLKNWLDESNYVFIDPNIINTFYQSSGGKDLAIFIDQYLKDHFQPFKIFDENFWPEKIILFEKKNARIS